MKNEMCLLPWEKAVVEGVGVLIFYGSIGVGVWQFIKWAGNCG